MNREEWLAERRKAIGASDVPIILGLASWCTPLELYLRKRGELPEPEPTDEMLAGIEMEDTIAKMYAQRTARKLTDPGRHTMQRNAMFPHLHATLDRKIEAHAVENRDGWGPLEIKNVGGHATYQWREGAPLAYQAQLMTQMMVTNTGWGSLCALIGGQDLVWFDYEYDADVATWINSETKAFHKRMILGGDPPEPTAKDRKALTDATDVDPGRVVALSLAGAAVTAAYDKMMAQLAICETRKGELENLIRVQMGSAEVGLLPDGGGWTWKESQRTEKAREARTVPVRTLRRKR